MTALALVHGNLLFCGFRARKNGPEAVVVTLHFYRSKVVKPTNPLSPKIGAQRVLFNLTRLLF